MATAAGGRATIQRGRRMLRDGTRRVGRPRLRFAAARAAAVPLVRAGLCAAALAAAFALGAPGARAAAVQARVTWLGSAPAGQRLQLVFPLDANLTGLERFARAVTTFGSPQYGDYEPIAWLARRFGASPETRARVSRFLEDKDATAVKIDATGLFADATVKVRLAQRLFGTALARFETARAGRYVAPTSAARLPAACAAP